MLYVKNEVNKLEKKHYKIIRCIIQVAIPLMIGGVIALLTNDAMRVYTKVDKPFLSPPSIVFPIVWTILYILMGIATFRMINRVGSKHESVVWYYAQLVINATWPLVFFNLEQYFMALLILILLMIFVLVLVISYYQLDKIAGYLMIPYFLWLCFALYLNMGVWILNI